MPKLKPNQLNDLIDRLEDARGEPIVPLHRLMLHGLNDREGFTTHHYRDTLGNPTGGICDDRSVAFPVNYDFADSF